ncbi:helix-turn-helix transcriptional regulator, partial [Moraxella catarrhalis]
DVTHETRKLRMGKRTLSNLGVMPENAFAVTARDDSMMPYVQDGDTIYIDKGRKEIKDGRIFAIRFGELCLCKRLYRLPDGGVRIVSDNSDEFPEQVATKQQISDGEFEVIGWVWSVSRLERW